LGTRRSELVGKQDEAKARSDLREISLLMKWDSSMGFWDDGWEVEDGLWLHLCALRHVW
jgi:hypothetical protein